MIGLFYLTTIKQDDLFFLGSIIDQSTGEIIELEELINKYDYAFVDENINLVWADICQLLLQKGYHQEPYEKKADKLFSVSYKSGACINITIKNGQKTLRIANFSSKFNIDYGEYEENKKLLDYANKKERQSSSLGNDAFNEWIRSAFKVHGRILNINASKAVFRRDYPILTDDETRILETAKANVSGFQHVKTGRYKNLYEYDICSSFPSQLINATPKGETIIFDEISDIPRDYFYIVKFTALNVKLKPNCFDIFSARDTMTLTLTKHMFELFNKNYEYSDIGQHFCFAYKTRTNIFNDFVFDNIITGKEHENDKQIAKYNKSITNSIIGYFGRNTESEQSYYAYNPASRKFNILRQKIKREPIYQPIYLFVNGKAKFEFISVLQDIVGIKHVIYANTDGFITDKEIDLKALNFGRNSQLGYFKLKCKYTDIQINSINGYVGITDTGTTKQAISGIKLTGLITPDQYANADYSYTIHELDEESGLIRETKLQS